MKPKSLEGDLVVGANQQKADVDFAGGTEHQPRPQDATVAPTIKRPWKSSSMTMVAARWAELGRNNLFTIVMEGPQDVVAVVFDDDDAEEQKRARLIAAAPDLLAALERSLNWLSSYHGGGAIGAYDQARAAIAKATGAA